MPRMMLVAAPDDPEVVAPETETPADDPMAPSGVMDRPEEFHALLIVEGTETGDDRVYVEGSVRWRDLPIPLTASDESPHGPGVVMGKHVGWITRVERLGNEVHGYGSYLPVELRDEQAARFIGMIQTGDMRGISAELDDVEMELVITAEQQEADRAAMEAMYGDDEEPGTADDPETFEDVVIPLTQPLLRTTESRLMGACAVLMPAFQECFIEPTGALVASACRRHLNLVTTGLIMQATPQALVASLPGITVPDVPPLAYFLNPDLPGVTPPTLGDDGRYFGHLAAHGSCHIGYSDCVTPPLSLTEYAHFLTGELVTAEGQRVAVGRITMDTGHAAAHLSAAAAVAHYDHTGTVVADVVVGEDAYGIWFSGALRTGISPQRMRALMAADVSGDWRRIAGNLELVSILNVNVGGFHKPRVCMRKNQGVVAALTASFGAWPAAITAAAAARAHSTDCGCQDTALARKVIDRLATSLGKPTTAQRMAALRARKAAVR